LTSRERVITTVDHKEPDKIPLDLGSTLNTGIHIASLYKLTLALGLAKPSARVKVLDSFFMLGEVDCKLRKALGIDTIPLLPQRDFLGFERKDWRSWTFFDGTPVLAPGEFNTNPDKDGNIYQYPRGDNRFPPSAKMPKNGFYHDSIIRQKSFTEEELKIEDQIEEYKVYGEEELRYFEKESKRLFEETDLAIVFEGVPGTNLGDIGEIPGPSLENPRGIRSVDEWYISLLTRKDFIKNVFSNMTEIALTNLKLLNEAVGDRVQIFVVSEADFGSQQSLLISIDLYRELFKPFHKEVNNWIHKNTSWKTFIHTCGSVYNLIPDIIEAGFDILSPVQISALGMDPLKLKNDFGNQITFWGGGVNTQSTLPFGTPQEVREEVRRLVKIFRIKGGFVFAAVHNIQANVPVENLIALFETFNECR